MPDTFWETPVGKTMAESGGASFLNGADKDALISSGISFQVNNVVLMPETQFGSQYYMYIDFPDVATGDTEERIMTFGSDSKVESRNNQLRAMADYFEGGGVSFPCKLTKVGRSQIIVKAE
jgi:hypothetical protein